MLQSMARKRILYLHNYQQRALLTYCFPALSDKVIKLQNALRYLRVLTSVGLSNLAYRLCEYSRRAFLHPV